MPSVEIKIPAQFIYLGKSVFFEECIAKYFALNLQLFYPSFDFLKIRLKPIMALYLDERSFPVFHYRRNEKLNGLSCFGVYQPLALLVMMKECMSYRVHHVNVMISIDGDVNEDDDNNDFKLSIVTHLSLILIKIISF